MGTRDYVFPARLWPVWIGWETLVSHPILTCREKLVLNSTNEKKKGEDLAHLWPSTPRPGDRPLSPDTRSFNYLRVGVANPACPPGQVRWPLQLGILLSRTQHSTSPIPCGLNNRAARPLSPNHFFCALSFTRRTHKAKATNDPWSEQTNLLPSSTEHRVIGIRGRVADPTGKCEQKGLRSDRPESVFL